jgi:rare lipoprotein A
LKYRTFVLLSIVLILVSNQAEAYETKTSYYTEASCREEGTSGICADGSRLRDNQFTCASWGYPFGTILKVTNERGVSVEVRVTDRGPGHKALKRGVTIDLSRAAFERLAPLRKGVINVDVLEMR